MNVQAAIGHNHPPNPIDDILAPFGDTITEAESWQDGAKVENESQMKAVDALTKGMKAALKAVKDGEKSAAAPLHDAWKAEKALWKPTIDDVTLQVKGLVSLVGDFKTELAAKKREEERAEWEKADKLRREAEAKEAAAASGDIEAQREAAEAKAQAMAQQKVASTARKDTVKGMRTVTKYAFFEPTEDNPRGGHKLALDDIKKSDPRAVTAFLEEYVRLNHKERTIAGVRVWTEKEAF